MRDQTATATRQDWEIERDRRNCLAELQEVARIRFALVRDLLPSFIIHEDGYVEPFYPSNVNEALDKMNEMSKYILFKYGFDSDATI